CMRMMPIGLCRPGMKLAKKIFSDDGRVLLAEGKELTSSFIRRIEECGIHYLYVQDSRTDDLHIPDLLRDETRRQALNTVRSTFQSFVDQAGDRKSSPYPYVGRHIQQTMKLIMEDLSRNDDAMI